jgi:3-oxoacyl-[acyl-carrier protein] reductase
MAECGATIGINYCKNLAGAEETLRLVEAAGGSGALIHADVSNKVGAQAVVAAAREKLGAIDILVNNAGDLIERRSLLEFDEELWDRVVNLNLKSVWLVSQAAMGEMIERQKRGEKPGTIINVGSIAGHHGGGPGAAVYAMTKAAVHCLTKGMAKELAPHGIRVNAVAPGVIETPFHERMSTPAMMQQFAASIPMGRTGTPEECGRVIAFLASDAAAYIHGELIEINGGQLMV